MDRSRFEPRASVPRPSLTRRSLIRGAAGGAAVAAGVSQPAIAQDATPLSIPGSAGAEILWDTWGVPHIFAEDAVGLFYAFGWAQAHNHGDLLLQLYARARGRAAAVYGEDLLPSDRAVRTMGLHERGRLWHRAQSEGFRANVDAFAAGINAYALQHGERLDDAARMVLPVDGTDVLAHLARILYLFLAGASDILDVYPANTMLGSNGWAIAPSYTASGHALLLANPHLIWGGEHTFFEAQLQAPGVYDAYGATLVGVPVPAIAFNDHLGWTHTNNTLDPGDLYLLTLDGDGYRFNDEVRDFERRIETVEVRQDDGTMREEALHVRRSVHGPVIETADEQTVAIRLAGVDEWSSSAGTLEQWWDMARATNLAEFDAVVRRMQLPYFHIIYADRDGHIQLLFNGHVPVRPLGDIDWSSPIPGDTTATLWTEIHAYDDLPRVADPPSGWVQNSNSPPWYAANSPALDPGAFPSYMAPHYLTLREQRGMQMLEEHPHLSLDQVVKLQFSTHMDLAARVVDDLVSAARRSGDAPAGSAAEVLVGWDRQALPDSTGTLLFVFWLQAMQPVDVLTLADLFAIPWDPAQPLTTPRGLQDPDRAVQALIVAAQQVKAGFGRLDVPWGEVARLQRGSVDLPANGAPGDPFGVFRVLYFNQSHLEATGQMPAIAGDTYVAAVEFSDPVRARVLLTYGNASQPDSPHFGDQLALSAMGEMRVAWRTRAEIEAHLEAREVLTIGLAERNAG